LSLDTNVLRNDLKTLFHQELSPLYDGQTKSYLTQLYNGLANDCHIARVACMVAFEVHAEKMIQALWESLVHIFKIEPRKLHYFQMHVGGTSPAEKYHLDLTKEMILKVVPQNKEDDFLKLFANFFKKNEDWCSELCKACKDALSQSADLVI